MDNEQMAEHRKTIIEQLEAIIGYVSKFEVLTQKDEAALSELRNLVNTLTLHVYDMDAAQKKRIQLMHELANAYNDLEESQKKFAEKVKTKAV